MTALETYVANCVRLGMIALRQEHWREGTKHLEAATQALKDAEAGKWFQPKEN